MVRMMPFINFFLLGFLILVLYYYVHRLRCELRIIRELRELANQYKTLIEASTEGVFQMTTDGSFNILNDAGARILGYASAKELLHKEIDWHTFIPHFDDFFEEIKDPLFREGLYQEQIELKINNQKSIIVEVTAQPKYDEQGMPVAIEGIFRNITEQVEMHNQLQHYSEQLENMVKVKTSINLQLEREKFTLEKLAAVGQASSTIVHEIRNPLSSVKMALTTLLSRAVFNENDEKLIHIAIREINYLEKMLKEILDYSKPQKLNLTTQNIHQIITHLGNLHKELYEKSKIEYIEDFSIESIKVNVDLDKIIQVFTNLILNAVQAMDGGGRLTVQTHLKNLSTIEIKVTDTGAGIKKENLEKIFHPFFSTKAKGTGLGLSLVRKIVNGHNGKVWVHSEPDKGTTITINLPICRSV